MIYPRAILIETTNTHIYIYWNDDTSIAAKNIGNLKWVCLKMKYSIASPHQTRKATVLYFSGILLCYLYKHRGFCHDSKARRLGSFWKSRLMRTQPSAVQTHINTYILIC